MGIELGILSGISAIGSVAMGIGGMVTQSGAHDQAIAGGQAAAQGAIERGRATNEADVFNAGEDEVQAANAVDVAAASRQDFERAGSDTVESAVAARGATGVTMEGSPLMVDEDTVRKVALGAARITAKGSQTASALMDDAQLKRMAGRNAITASYLDANTSLLTGQSAATNADAAMWNSGASILGNVTKFANPNFGKASV